MRWGTVQNESTVNYGQEIGENLIKVCKKLLRNQNLCKLLVYTDLEPLSHPDLSQTIELMNRNIAVVPGTVATDESTESQLVVLFSSGGVTENPDNESLHLMIYVYVPYVNWLIAGNQLRPFAIMAEVRKSLQNRRINGLGEIRYDGFCINSLTDQMGSYTLEFYINAFN